MTNTRVVCAMYNIATPVGPTYIPDVQYNGQYIHMWLHKKDVCMYVGTYVPHAILSM